MKVTTELELALQNATAQQMFEFAEKKSEALKQYGISMLELGTNLEKFYMENKQK
jgi:hypothetical protein